MARRTAEITITGPNAGRDSNKTFLLTEMLAIPGERWAARALGILARSGADTLPSDMEGVLALMQGGWQALAALGVRAALLSLNEEAFPLLEEMLTCVQIKEDKITRPLVQEDIEEVFTLLRLRDEVLRLHTNFSIIETLSKQGEILREVIESSSTSQTSPTASEQSSPFG